MVADVASSDEDPRAPRWLLAGRGAWMRWRRLFSSRQPQQQHRMSGATQEERTGADLSRCLAGVAGAQSRARSQPPPATAMGSPEAGQEVNGHGVGPLRTAVALAAAAGGRSLTLGELWQNDRFLNSFFLYFGPHERRTFAQVCSKWRDVLYQPKFWLGLMPVLHCRELRGAVGKAAADMARVRKQLYASMQKRGFDGVCLLGANDDDVYDLINNFPPCAKHVHRVALRCASVTDKGLETLLDHMQCVYQLELSGCNEITEAGLWGCLNPRLVSLAISDCINVADESVGAVAQLLPSLYEFNLQAYHVTDAALGYFSTKQATSLSILRLTSCWEVTNHGLVNIVHALPNLTVLSLSGCSKITDDGVELVAENLRNLRSLDLSWCPRITDAALEYIACDLTQLEELTLDRCVHITDIGVGYISTMVTLTSLFLRWCSQIRDFGLQHLCSMRNLQVLSLAGCSLLTSSGLSSLIQLRHLQELELTNCPGASRELFDYLHEHLSKCLIIE